MVATQFTTWPFSSEKVEDQPAHSEHLGNSAAATLIEVAVELNQDKFGTEARGACVWCRRQAVLQTSTAECRNGLCSKTCEQEFLRAALRNVTLDDCIEMHARLEALLAGAQSKIDSAFSGRGAKSGLVAG